MDKLADKLYGKLKHEATKLKREAKKIAELETPLEKNIREATSNQNWNCSNTILYELCSSASDYHDRRKILDTVWEKLDSKPDRWRRIVKTLTLLEFLIKNGPDSVMGEVQGEQLKVRRLTDFHAYDEGQDRGAAIREKAKAILELVSDQALLRSEREKAKEHRAKFFVSSGGGESLSQGGGYSGGSRETQDHSRKAMERRFEELKQKRDAEQAAAADRKAAAEARRGVADRRTGKDREHDERRRDDSDEDRPRRRGNRDEDEGDGKESGYERWRGGGDRDKGSDSERDERRGRAPEPNPGTQGLFDLLDEGGGSGASKPAPAAAPAPAPAVDLLDMFDGGGSGASKPASAAAAAAAPAAAPAPAAAADLLDMFGDSAPMSSTPAPASAQAPAGFDMFGDSAAPAAPSTSADNDWGGFASAPSNSFPAPAAPAAPFVGW